MGKQNDKGSGEEIEADGSGIDEPGGEVGEVLLGGEVAEKACSLEAVTPDDGDIAEEVVEDKQADGDDACNDLGGGERGAKEAKGGKVGAHQHQYKHGAKEGTAREGGGDVGENGEKDEVNRGGDEEDKVEGEGGTVFSENDLPGFDGGRHQCFEGAGAFLFGKKTHGDERENEEEVKPEVGGMVSDVDEGLRHGSVGKAFHRGGK